MSLFKIKEEIVMIRVDYSGLNWKLVGKRVQKVHIGGVDEICMGDVYYSKQFDSHFCTTCGMWLDRDKKLKNVPKRPETAFELLLILERIRKKKKE